MASLDCVFLVVFIDFKWFLLVSLDLASFRKEFPGLRGISFAFHVSCIFIGSEGPGSGPRVPRQR